MALALEVEDMALEHSLAMSCFATEEEETLFEKMFAFFIGELSILAEFGGEV